MDFLFNSITKALQLILSLDPELTDIVLLSLKVSGIAIVIASALGLTITLLLDLRDFRGKGIVVTVINTFMGLPPVVAGLLLYLILSRSGPLGFLNLLYTPSAMVMAQVILATPIIAGLTYAVTVSANPSIRLTAVTLGGVMAEVGAVLIVGGNIAGYTRVMTTAIALEADKGDFELAVALGIILLAISFTINGTLFMLQKKEVRK
jgi:tungstate transport system permease protein